MTRKRNKIDVFTNSLRFSEPYSEWRNEVVREQGGKCQICGSKSKLHIHHIKYFRTIVKEFLERYSNFDVIRDEDSLLDCAEFYDDLWDPDNGLVLCEDCHSAEHLNLMEIE